METCVALLLHHRRFSWSSHGSSILVLPPCLYGMVYPGVWPRGKQVTKALCMKMQLLRNPGTNDGCAVLLGTAALSALQAGSWALQVIDYFMCVWVALCREKEQCITEQVLGSNFTNIGSVWAAPGKTMHC